MLRYDPKNTFRQQNNDLRRRKDSPMVCGRLNAAPYIEGVDGEIGSFSKGRNSVAEPAALDLGVGLADCGGAGGMAQ